MAGKPNKPEDLQKSYNLFSWEEFVMDVIGGKYVLLIGPEVMLNRELLMKTVDGLSEEEKAKCADGDINKYIVTQINHHEKQHYSDFFDIAHNSRANEDKIRSYLNDKDAFVTELQDIDPDLQKLIATRRFPLILTTTIDDYLIKLMEKIWGERGKDFLVASLLDDESMKAFNKQYSAGIRKPALIYLFGNAMDDMRGAGKKDVPGGDYVKSDTVALRVIDKLMKDKITHSNDRFPSFLYGEKKLLALGCKCEDWRFRILWFTLTGSDVYTGNKWQNTGQVALCLRDENPEEDRLKKFLEWVGLFDNGDARKFIVQVCFHLTDEFIKQITSRGRGNRNSIFISYDHDDKETARALCFALRRADFDVWIDEDEPAGGAYNEDIPNQILESAAVVALITPKLAYKLERFDAEKDSESQEPYYLKEWSTARDGKVKIIPFAADGFDPSEEQYGNHVEGRLESVSGGGASAVSWNEPGGFNKLVTALQEEVLKAKKSNQ